MTAATTSSLNSYSHEKWFAEIRKKVLVIYWERHKITMCISLI